MSTTTTTEIDPATAHDWIESGQAVLIDVREPDEHAIEHIQGAKLVPLSRFDPGQVQAQGSKVILHCRSGRRSMEARARLAAAGQFGEIYSLKGGIDAWRTAGLPTRRAARAPLPIMRQVQMTAGSLVVIGTLLGATISQWFLIIPAFVGTGLVFAGLSGTCGMAAMLSVMPWNRAFRSPAMA